jgi:hypothetical protein
MDQEKIFMIGSPILFLKNRTTCILCLGAERDALFHPKKEGNHTYQNDSSSRKETRSNICGLAAK